MIDRRDIRVLAEGWYEFKIDGVEEVVTEYGPGIKIQVSVVSGKAEGGRLGITSDRVATPGNKTGRLLAVIGFDPYVELPVEVRQFTGRRFGGRVVRYVSNGRTRAKVVEFCLAEKVREKIASYSDQGR